MTERDQKRGEIGPGDLIRTIKELPRLKGEDLQQVAQFLGFALDVSEADKNIGQQNIRWAWKRSRQSGKRPDAKKPPEFSPKPVMPPIREIQPDLPEKILVSDLEMLDPVDPAPTPIPSAIDRHQPLQIRSARPVSRQRLFSNNTTRGLLVPAVAQPASGIDPDIPGIIDCFVRCRFPASLPTRTRYTTRSGCHLLLDFSEQLTPWWPDMRDVIEQIHAVLGPESAPVYEFEGDPAHAVRWTGSKEIPWKPVAGIPVLVASDLGTVSARPVGYRPGAEVWRRFAGNCASRQVPVIALVPVDRGRLAKGLDRLIKMIHWNPATDAASVQRLLGEFR